MNPSLSFRLQGVSVRHADQRSGRPMALSGIDLAISQGEQVALIGPSGAGKTTLLHTLAGAHRADAGSLHALGQSEALWEMSSRERHALRRQLFLAPQSPPLPPRQRVVTAVLAARLPQWSLWQALRSLVRPAGTDVRLAFEALGRFNLQHKLYERVDRLSGGERQRCGMARLLVSQARVFLVDEPLSALDPTLAGQTLRVLQQEAAARGATLVCSLHQVDLALESFARIVGLRDGSIVFDLPRAEVTPALIDTLYRQDGGATPAPAASPVPALARVAAARCY